MKTQRCWLLIATANFAMGQGYEVWLTDQNNTAGYSADAPRGTHGGRLVIHDGEVLESPGGPVDRPALIDLAEMFALGGANNSTGANVSRPHMIFQSPTSDYMALAFVASGHVAIIDGATRRPKALFRMSAGDGGARQAHAAFWMPDGLSLIVANQNGKLLEKIVYDPMTDAFRHDTAATLNLATCRTPNGFPCQTATPVNEGDPGYFGPHNRPDNAPISPVTSANRKVYVTFRGGGMFVVDPSTIADVDRGRVWEPEFPARRLWGDANWRECLFVSWRGNDDDESGSVPGLSGEGRVSIGARVSRAELSVDDVLGR